MRRSESKTSEDQIPRHDGPIRGEPSVVWHAMQPLVPNRERPRSLSPIGGSGGAGSSVVTTRRFGGLVGVKTSGSEPVQQAASTSGRQLQRTSHVTHAAVQIEAGDSASGREARARMVG